MTTAGLIVWVILAAGTLCAVWPAITRRKPPPVRRPRLDDGDLMQLADVTREPREERVATRDELAAARARRNAGAR